MKGYLRRLVMTAARPERTVHPLVGGMFLKERQQGIVEESALVSAPKERRKIDSDLVEEREFRETAMSERGEFTPRALVERTEDRDARPDRLQEQAIKTEREKSKTVETEKLTRPDHSGVAERRANTFEIRDLLVPDVAGREPEQRVEREVLEIDASTQNVPQNFRSHLSNKMKAERPPREEHPRGSEDIQIHIGRIEVIAVPPPVQRAAPAPVRKSESLEEYLRRRDRRVR